MIYTIENTVKKGLLATVKFNGVKLNNCFYADDEKGIVKFYDDPPKKHKHGKRLISRTRKGVVKVDVQRISD